MRIAVIDTETAGITPPDNGSGVCDVAIILVDVDLRHKWEVESLIDPECLIRPEAMGVHHITHEMVADQPTLDEFMELYDRPLCDVDVVAGHRVSFDVKFLRPFLPERYEVIDTLKLSRTLWPEAENHKLQTLRYLFDLDAGKAHRALGDATTTLSLMRKIAEEYVTDAHGLLRMMSIPMSLHSRMAFGKHKGEKLKDLPRSYVHWLVNKAEIEPDLKEALLERL